MSDRGATDRASRQALDWMIAGALSAATAAYLSWLPWNLGAADESFFLYEARRIREGEVMYRDFFQFVAPGAWYFMALLYRIFGTSMATARISTAVLHSATALVLYASCRRMDVRRGLAVVAALAYVALCPPAWPYASPHWYSTFLVALLLLAAIPGAWSERRGASLALGILTGMLIMVQQQKGAVMAAAIVLLFVADAGLHRVIAGPRRIGLSAQLVFLGAGVAICLAPSLLAMVAAAGWRPVFDDLVLYPLNEYRGKSFATRWGSVGVLPRGLASYTWPALLRLLPFVAVPAALRVAVAVVAAAASKRSSHRLVSASRVSVADARLQLTLLAFLLGSAVSVLYNPDFIHLAFIAPVGLAAAAQATEQGLRWLPSRALSSLTGWVLASLVAVMLSRQILGNTTRLRAGYPYRHETAFGRIDFERRWEPVFVDRLRAALDAAQSREIFCYPFASAPYLTAGAHNPTPFQHLAPEQSPAWQIEQALSILRARQVEFIVAVPIFLKPKDPIAQLINERYELVNMPELFLTGEFPQLWLYARTPDEGGAP